MGSLKGGGVRGVISSFFITECCFNETAFAVNYSTVTLASGGGVDVDALVLEPLLSFDV